MWHAVVSCCHELRKKGENFLLLRFLQILVFFIKNSFFDQDLWRKKNSLEFYIWLNISFCFIVLKLEEYYFQLVFVNVNHPRKNLERTVFYFVTLHFVVEKKKEEKHFYETQSNHDYAEHPPYLSLLHAQTHMHTLSPFLEKESWLDGPSACNVRRGSSKNVFTEKNVFE